MNINQPKIVKEFKAMPRTRYVARPRPEKTERPFDSVAEAWFWSARALRAR